MSTTDSTVRFAHEPQHDRTLAGLALALASGAAPGDFELDLDDPAQRRLGAYTLVERIGAGGMGLVYRAHQESLERDVAIKFLGRAFARDEAALERFRFEARSAAALNHPNIVQVYEIGDVHGLAFIAMQLVRGESLAEQVRRRQPGRAEAIALMLKLCDAVGYAHRLGLLHLDLKPANVLIDERGEPLIADFGLARRMNPQGQVEAQEVSGTPGYMAPEQVLVKQFRLSAATDIYALGGILYELVCGQPPHGRGTAEDVLQRALAGRIRPPREADRSIPRDLEAICLKCLALRAPDRYADVATLAADLRHYADSLPVSVRAPTRLERVVRWYAREPRFALALAALLVVTSIASVTMARLYDRASFERLGAEGLAQLLMAETPTDEPQIVGTRESYAVPIFDCTDRRIHCGGGINFASRINDALPLDQEAGYVAALRGYVPKIAAWGNPRLSRQLAAKIEEAETALKAIALTDAMAATGSPEGLAFAYVMGHSKTPSDSEPPDLAAWLARAIERPDAPRWVIQMLAQTCTESTASCDAAVRRFRELDPDNAAAWTAALRGEPGAEGDRILLRAAAAPRLEHGREALLHGAMAFAQGFMPTQPAAARLTPEAFALEIEFLAGMTHYPFTYCQRSLAMRDAPEIAAACVTVASKVEPAMRPMLVDELLARTLLVRMSANEAERAERRRRLRDARWVYSVVSQLPADDFSDRAKRIAIVIERGELEYLRELIRARGLPLEAPDAFVMREPLPWPRVAN